jgi:hypothetical protein
MVYRFLLLLCILVCESHIYSCTNYVHARDIYNEWPFCLHCVISLKFGKEHCDSGMHKFLQCSEGVLQNFCIIMGCIVQGARFIASPSFRILVSVNMCIVISSDAVLLLLSESSCGAVYTWVICC